jgi:hypothetical protein
MGRGVGTTGVGSRVIPSEAGHPFRFWMLPPGRPAPDPDDPPASHEDRYRC